MCGIAGCVGHHKAVSFVTNGLDLMEKRGYDSAGIAYPIEQGPKLEVIRAVGAVSKLVARIPENAVEATTAIGHTRWATHGNVLVRNAHPQFSSDRTIAAVHNGTIYNFEELKEELTQEHGYVFKSDTDTEVVPHLLDHYMRQGAEPDEAFYKTIRRLDGAHAILALFGIEPDTIYASRRGSNPLLMGVRGDERFVASMRGSIRPYTRWMDPMENNEMARLSADSRRYRTWHLDGKTTTREPKKDTGEIEIPDMKGFDHWMIKEIHDGPETVREALRGRLKRGEVRLGGLEDPEIKERLDEADRILILGMGTSMHAGMIGERLIEEIADIPVDVQDASEFIDKNEPLGRHTVAIGISQSGETLDTLAALHKTKGAGLLTLGINNSPGSEMETITDAGVHCNAREEMSVASTKAFISQVTVLAEIAFALSKQKTPLYIAVMRELPLLPEKIERILAKKDEIEEIAKKYAKAKNFYFLGRGYEHASALEGALKLKEVSEIHAEGYSSGQMKHGPISLIDRRFPTFAIATDSTVFAKAVTNIEETHARKGPVIVLATEGNQIIAKMLKDGKVDDVIYVPGSLEQTQPILNAVAMQLFAYYMAVEKNKNPDKPRNLAKTVTVE